MTTKELQMAKKPRTQDMTPAQLAEKEFSEALQDYYDPRNK
jgi:hypothetical protein